MHDNVHDHTAPNETFAHERLDAYRVAVEFLDVAEALTKRLPKTKGQLGDQLLSRGYACSGQFSGMQGTRSSRRENRRR